MGPNQTQLNHNGLSIELNETNAWTRTLWQFYSMTYSPFTTSLWEISVRYYICKQYLIDQVVPVVREKLVKSQGIFLTPQKAKCFSPLITPKWKDVLFKDSHYSYAIVIINYFVVSWDYSSNDFQLCPTGKNWHIKPQWRPIWTIFIPIRPAVISNWNQLDLHMMSNWNQSCNIEKPNWAQWYWKCSHTILAWGLLHALLNSDLLTCATDVTMILREICMVSLV